MSDDNTYEILIRLDQRVGDMHRELLGGDGAEGRIPKVEKKLDKHSEQLHYWRGAVALTGVLILAFGGVLLAHVLTGK